MLLKALIFARYADRYPSLAVEVSIGHRYKPDLVALDEEGRPLFWAECGHTGRDKIARLLRRLPKTHLVFAKLATRLQPFEQIIRQAWPSSGRSGLVELLSFRADAAGCRESVETVVKACQPEERIVFGDEIKMSSAQTGGQRGIGSQVASNRSVRRTNGSEAPRKASEHERGEKNGLLPS
ncbi:MAG: hypothetical protein M3Q03_17100 [Chloroflexota bacterium]|nr:hypothetical protein [Chloroflexota bacterium]